MSAARTPLSAPTVSHAPAHAHRTRERIVAMLVMPIPARPPLRLLSPV
jgi:hypothetical protein